MKYMDEDFLLTNEYAKNLYHNYAEKCPIFDFHNHLDAKEIFEDKKFDSITSFWLIDENKHGDHYKWRLMRANGVSEDYITGDKSPKEKFLMWMKTLRSAIGNPLYEWSLLELKRYFGMEEPLKYSDEELYDILNSKLGSLSVRTLLKQSNVVALATTNDPLEDLRYHRSLMEDKTNSIRVAPTFRPDKATNISSSKEYSSYVKELGEKANIAIDSYSSLLQALENRLLFFKENGSFISDHSIEELYFTPLTDEEKEKIFAKALQNKEIEEKERLNFKSNLILDLARLYKKYCFAMQLHLKASRNNNERMYRLVGVDSGFDAINSGQIIPYLSKMFSILDKEDALPKTILYSLDSGDWMALAALAYCFQDGKTRGKMQLGAAWWFNDNKVGMEKQLSVLSNVGLLSTFVGMVTDSRSFLSYARHEYFRRVLCNYLGKLIEEGQIPYDEQALSLIIKGVCFANAESYFGR